MFLLGQCFGEKKENNVNFSLSISLNCIMILLVLTNIEFSRSSRSAECVRRTTFVFTKTV